MVIYGLILWGFTLGFYFGVLLWGFTLGISYFIIKAAVRDGVLEAPEELIDTVRAIDRKLDTD